MIVHALRFSFKDGTSEEDLAAIEAALRRLASSEATAFSVVGRDLGGPDYRLAYVVAFEDLAALEHYMLREPSHIAADRVILPHLAKLAALDLADDPDAEIGAKVAALHQRRLETDHEFAELLGSIEGDFAVEA